MPVFWVGNYRIKIPTLSHIFQVFIEHLTCALNTSNRYRYSNTTKNGQSLPLPAFWTPSHSILVMGEKYVLGITVVNAIKWNYRRNCGELKFKWRGWGASIWRGHSTKNWREQAVQISGDWFSAEEQPVYMGPEARNGRPLMVKEQHWGSDGIECAFYLATPVVPNHHY